MVRFAAASSPHRNMLALWPATLGFAMCSAPIVLKHFTTLAPLAQRATSSPAEVVNPTANPERSGVRGLVASTTIFPPTSPTDRTAFSVLAHGVASTMTSADEAASLG